MFCSGMFGGAVLQRWFCSWGEWSLCVVLVVGGSGVLHLWWVVVVHDCVGCLFPVVAVRVNVLFGNCGWCCGVLECCAVAVPPTTATSENKQPPQSYTTTTHHRWNRPLPPTTGTAHHDHSPQLHYHRCSTPPPPITATAIYHTYSLVTSPTGRG